MPWIPGMAHRGLAQFPDSPRCPASYCLSHLRIASIHLSKSDGFPRREPHNTLGRFYKLTILRHSTLRAFIHRVHIYGPIVGRGGGPPDAASPSQYLPRQQSPAQLLSLGSAPRFPPTCKTCTQSRLCTRMVSATRTFGELRGVAFQAEIPQTPRSRHRCHPRLPDSNPL